MERLQKVMAAAGIASRRKCEELIVQGRVSVNGQLVSELGYKVKKGDQIAVDGKMIEKEGKVYYLMNKPKKSMCTSNDEFGRKTVIELVEGTERIFTVGRLDYDTSGVLLLTNDGDFANEIIHPRYHLPKVYNLTINGILKPEDMRKLKNGIVLDDGYKTMPAKFKITEKDLDVQTQLPDGPVMVWGDPDAVTQVCYNLLDNAVKFSSPQGRLTLRITTKAGKAYIAIGNQGETIPPQQLTHIFDRFHKADSSRSTHKDGVGLGLYIVKTILNTYKEDITVTSQDGFTEFTFTLSEV